MIKNIPDNSVKLVLTDPPYGIDFQSNRIKDKEKRKKKILNDKIPFTGFIESLNRVLMPQSAVMIFTRWDVQQNFIDELNKNGFKVKNIIIWDKQIHGMGDLKRSYGNRYESILFCANNEFRFPQKRPQDIISVRRVLPTNLVHPNEKPVELLETLIRQTTNTNDIVLDCFAGSGSTGVACINTNRKFIGMELDQKYFDIASKRIEETIINEDVS